MCGLVFIGRMDADPDLSHTLYKGLTALRHRGPDGQNQWTSADQRTAMGHTRLAITGGPTAVQPLVSEDEKIRLVVNGEFYDYKNWRERLILRGHRFLTTSDSELALHLYREYGTDFLQFLRGEFALILWDASEQRMIAARDRFGIKPLYYTSHHGIIKVASEAKALLAMGESARWDEASIGIALQTQYLPPWGSAYQGITQIPPGFFLSWKNQNAQLCKYADLPQMSSSHSSSFQDTAEEFRVRLQQSLRDRLDTEAPLCFHLSGGIDSASLVALAAKSGARKIKTFTLAFDHPLYDESELVTTWSQQTQLFDNERITLTAIDLLEALPASITASESPCVNAHLPAKYLLNRVISAAGYRVVITGEGGDELLLGYPHFLEDAGALDTSAIADPTLRGIMLPHGSGLSLENVHNLIGHIPSFLKAKATLGYKMRQVLRAEFQQQFDTVDGFGEVVRYHDDFVKEARSLPPVGRALTVWCKMTLANTILRSLGDGCEMPHALEARLPFLDHELFEWMATVPLDQRIHSGSQKMILRHAMKDFLPDDFCKRPKKPLYAPPFSLDQNPVIRDTLTDFFRSAAFSNQPFFDPVKILRLMEQMKQMPQSEVTAYDPIIMMALSLGHLGKAFHLS